MDEEHLVEKETPKQEESLKHSEHPSIEVARINARQALLGALIIGGFSVLTTLLATGHLLPKKTEGTQGDRVNSSSAKRTVLDAPNVAFLAKPIKLSLPQCMDRARKILSDAKLTGRDEGRYFVYAYNADVIGVIWCHTDEGLAIFLAAGKDRKRNADTMEMLRRMF